MANFVQGLTCQPYLISWTPQAMWPASAPKKNRFPAVADGNIPTSTQNLENVAVI